MNLEQQLTDAIAAQNALTQAVANWKERMDASVAAQQAAFAAWRAQLTAASIGAEPRYQFDIKIMGSPDWLYPVWWTFPDNVQPNGNITISRPYYWDGGAGTAHRNLRGHSEGHIAALLLSMEGNSCVWGGDANYMKIRTFSERYNNTASHASFCIACKSKPIDASKPLDYAPSYSPSDSGVYLRGGGLTYRITSNFTSTVNYIDGTKGDYEQRELGRYLNGLWYVQPIAFTSLSSPVVG